MNQSSRACAPRARPGDIASRIVWHRWWVICLALLIVGAAASGFSALNLTSNYRIFFSDRNPELQAYERLERAFSKTDNVVFVLKADDGDLFSPAGLAAIAWLTDAAWQLPYSTRVDSVTNFQDIRAEGDDLVVTDLVENADDLDAAAAARIRRKAVAEPELRNRLVSPDAEAAGVNVRLQFSDQQRMEIGETAGAARALAAEFRARYPGIEVRTAGFAMLSDAFARAPRQDAKMLMPVMFAVLAVLLALSLRSVAGAAATMAVALFSAVAALGAAGYMGAQLNPVSSMAPLIVITLAVAHSVHLLIGYRNQRRSGLESREAIAEGIRRTWKPITLTSLTTAVGFLSLNFSDAPPFWHLGNITALGVAATWLFSMTFLPAVMSLMPKSGAREVFVSEVFLARLGNAVTARPCLALALALVLCGALVAQIGRLEINDKPFAYFDESQDIRTATQFTIDNLTGVYNISYALGCGAPNCIDDPAYLQILGSFERWLLAQPEIIHVSAVTDIVKRLNRAMNGNDPAAYRLPGDRDLTAQYLLLYEMSLPYGLDLNDRIDVERSATRLDAVFGDVDFRIIKDVAERADAWLAENGMGPMRGQQATSQAVMFSHIAERNIDSMLWGAALAFGLIALILTAALKSLRLGLISLVPNMLPAAVALGCWALLSGVVNFAVSVVASVSIGIIVDDTVHFLSAYRDARRLRGLTPALAVRDAFTHVGQALLITTLVLGLGFSVLMLSPFHINVVMGGLTALTVMIALALDFVILPALLVLSRV